MNGTANLTATLLGVLVGELQFALLKVQHADICMENIHRKTRSPLVIAAICGTLAFASGTASVNRYILWRLPLWIETRLNVITWTPIFFALAFVMTLGVRAAWTQHHSERIKLTIAAVGLIAGLLILRFRLGSTLNAVGPITLTQDGFVLQTTGSTCAPAAAASIAKQFGLIVGESEMTQLMQTTDEGTSSGQVIIGMRALGLSGTRLTYSNAWEVPTPAMLFVDHVTAGPESHAIALLHADQHTAEIVDPLDGHMSITPAQLSATWHGKAIGFSRNE